MDHSARHLCGLDAGMRLRLEDFPVKVVLRIDTTAEDDRVFHAFEITGHPTLHWLSLGLSWGEDDGPLVGWTNQPTFRRRLAPVPSTRDVTIDGRPFTFLRSGFGDFQIRTSLLSDGASDIPEQGVFEYSDYLDGDSYLTFFRYGERPWITATGRTLRHHQVDVLAS